jgi:hypothetical protein
MTILLQQLLKEALSEGKPLTPEKTTALLQETFKLFVLLKQKGESSDPKEQEEVVQIAQSIKQAIQNQGPVKKQANVDHTTKRKKNKAQWMAG